MATGNFNINVKADFDKLDAALGAASQRDIKAAAVASLNRAVQSGKQAAVVAIKEQRLLSTTTIRQAIYTRKANFSNLAASINISFKPIGLEHFKLHNTVRGGGPISVQVTPTGSAHFWKNAFVSKGGKLPMGVIFERKGPPWKPIKLKALKGPSIPSAVRKSVVAGVINDRMLEVWQQTMRQQINYRFNKLGFKVT